MVRRMVWLPGLTRSDLSDSFSTWVPGCQVFLLLRGVTITSCQLSAVVVDVPTDHDSSSLSAFLTQYSS